jgi:hypothetical protein
MERIRPFILDVPPEDNPWLIAGRALVYLVLLVWGIRFFLTPIESDYWMRTFWHSVNLPFHEAGHIFFSIIGMGLIGGSLMQLIVPLVCLGAFLRQRNLFAASVALWWLGQNFMDLSPYINDARALKLPLLGGITGLEDPQFHDWHRILGNLGWLKYDRIIARLSYGAGFLLMAASLLWGGWVLYRQQRSVRNEYKG